MKSAIKRIIKGLLKGLLSIIVLFAAVFLYLEITTSDLDRAAKAVCDNFDPGEGGQIAVYVSEDADLIRVGYGGSRGGDYFTADGQKAESREKGEKATDWELACAKVS